MKLEADTPIVLIEPDVKDKIRQWVGIAKGEVSGLGLVEQDGSTFLITEVFLPFQSCGSADTVIEPEQVAKLMLEVEAQGHDPAQLKFWWHSHANMQVFWSTTDTGMISKFHPSDFFLSSVFNKQGEVLTRLDFIHPFRISFQDLALQVNVPDYGQRDLCLALFSERVKESVFTSYGTHDFFPPAYQQQSRIPVDEFEREELINAYCRGELDWAEAEALLEQEGLDGQRELFREDDLWE